MKVAVLGGGGFGRGLSLAAARRGHDVRLWSRSARDMDKVRATTDIAESEDCELILIAVPSPWVPDVADQLAPHLDGRHYLVHISRGLIGADLEPISKVLRLRTPAHRVGALAGPLIAGALAEGRASGAIVGTRFPEVADALREAIGSDTLRIYDTPDVVGVEVASAMVGLFALTIGYAQALDVDGATLAVFLTRAMAEASRIVPSLGADPNTLYGLAGFGDLIAVVARQDRPEVALGRALGGGQSLGEAAKLAGAHIEGVSIAARLAAHAERLQLEAPITRAIVGVLEGGSPREAFAALMARRVGSE